METTIRNLDEEAYRRIEAYAAREGIPVGEVISEAMRAYLAQKNPAERTGSLQDLPTADFGKGNEDLSERIDEVLYDPGPGGSA